MINIFLVMRILQLYENCMTTVFEVVVRRRILALYGDLFREHVWHVSYLYQLSKYYKTKKSSLKQ